MELGWLLALVSLLLPRIVLSCSGYVMMGKWEGVFGGGSVHEGGVDDRYGAWPESDGDGWLADSEITPSREAVASSLLLSNQGICCLASTVEEEERE